MTTPTENKANIAAQDRAIRDRLLGTRASITAAAKLAGRAITAAEGKAVKAGIELLEAIYEEGEGWNGTPCDYDKDIAPIVALAMETAYQDTEDKDKKGTRSTMRHNGKMFFLAGQYGFTTEDTKLNEMVVSYKEQLKAACVITEEGKGKGGGRKPRPSTVKDDKPSTATPTTIPVATTDAVDPTVTTEPSIPAVVKPGKAYTVEVRRNAALILSGTPALSQDIVQAFEVHREQVLKFIRQLIETDKAVKA